MPPTRVGIISCWQDAAIQVLKRVLVRPDTSHTIWISTMKTIILIVLTLCTSPLFAAEPPAPTQSDLAYGDHPKQVMHFWKAESDQPTALLFFIHGGGWMGGDRMNNQLLGMMDNLLKLADPSSDDPVDRQSTRLISTKTSSVVILCSVLDCGAK